MLFTLKDGEKYCLIDFELLFEDEDKDLMKMLYLSLFCIFLISFRSVWNLTEIL